MVDIQQNLNKYIGERIKQYRVSRGLSQRDIGKLLNIPFQRYQKYEVGETRIPAEILLKIANVFNVSLDVLLYDVDWEDETTRFIKRLPSLSGKSFDAIKLVYMILFFACMCKINKTKLNKLLFYSDFLFYKKQGKAISDVPYVKLPHGPAPESYNAILGILEGTGYIEITEVVLNEEKGVIEERITASRAFDQKLFTEEELEVLRKVALHLGGKTGAELSKMTHKEPFFDKLELGKPIDYEFAKELKTEL